MMSESKICRDCVHYKSGALGVGDKCTRRFSVDLITGYPIYNMAYTERFGRVFDPQDVHKYCGEDARFFESSEKLKAPPTSDTVSTKRKWW